MFISAIVRAFNRIQHSASRRNKFHRAAESFVGAPGPLPIATLCRRREPCGIHVTLTMRASVMAAADRNSGSRAAHDARERDEQSRDPRDVATRGLDLPRGQDRELIRVRERTYELNGAESRTLATIGAFRVVRTEDLRDPSDPRERGLKHLRDQGLVRSVSLGGRTRDVVVLTREGCDVLEARRREDAPEPRQAFYEGLRKPREVTHDAALYRAYRRAAERLERSGGRRTPRRPRLRVEARVSDVPSGVQSRPT